MGATSKGIATVSFGLAALVWPGLTLFVLIVFFGAYALVDGVLAIVAGIRGSEGRRWLFLAEGVLGVLTGLVAFFWPSMTALILLFVISAWAIFTGLLRVVMAISFKREIENAWLMGLSGVLAVLFGVAPTDAALGQAVVSNPRVLVRVRQALNVELPTPRGLGTDKWSRVGGDV